MQEQFNRYNLTAELAKKHSHVTYLASPASDPEHQVVLTVFASSLFHFSHDRENLLQKVQRIKQLQHSHLVPILDMGIEKEQPFVVREYLPNGSLRSRLKKISPRQLELGDTLTIVSQIGEALVYAHEHNIIHGNIKPENILFGANGHIFLTDFHLVARNDAIIRDQATEEYAFCYMAPEQFAGTCDTRSDQYALGCLVYELITGHVPFGAQTLASMMGQPNNALPTPLSASVPDLPPSLETAVLKTLAKDPEERFFDFSLFLEVIQSVLSPPPAFPLFRSTYSRKSRTVSYPAQSAKAKTISSLTPKRAASELLESSGVFSGREGNIAGPADEGQKHNSSSAILIEPMLQSEALTSELAMTTPIIEEEVDDVLLNDPFREEDVNRSLGLVSPGSSVLGQSQSGVGWIPSSLTSIDLPRPWAIRTLHSKRRVLGLTLLLSMIVALLTYAFWPSGMTQLNTNSHSAQDIMHVIIPKISMQTGNIPASQASNQATNNLAAQGATNNPKALSSSQTSIKENASSPSPSSTSSSLPSSSPSPSQGSTTTTNMTIYFAGWTDNSPPGASIAYPQIHKTAGGTGTYSDPITFAGSKNALSPGTIIYVSFLKKYFIMEDDCSNCDSTWNNNHTYEISLWIGGDSNSSSSAQQSCENSLTPNSPQPIQVQPSSSNVVDTTPLFTDSGGCIKL